MAPVHGEHAPGRVGERGAGAPAAGVYAVARVGARYVAIANAVVAQAVACPERLVQLPRRVGALEGLFSFQGRWVPVVRLSHWVDLGAEPAPGDSSAAAMRERRILVLRQAGQVIGLLVDAVMGVRQAQATELARVHHDERPDELFQSVIAAAGEQPALIVLEPLRLMKLAAAWCETAEIEPAATGHGVPAAGGVADASRHMPYAIFGIGDATVGIAAADVGELIPSPPLQSVMPTGSAARGICQWRGRFVPVVDLTGPLAATAQGTPGPSVCIVCHGELAIGVLVHEVGGLQAVDAARVEHRRGPDAACDVLLGATINPAGHLLQLLDTARLMACFPETALSAPREPGASGAGDGGSCSAEAFIVFDAGSLQAAPAAQVQEVVPLPAAVRARLDAGQPATLEWRGFAVPVVDLRRRLKSARDMRPAQLVVVADGERRAAVTIAAVKELIAARTAVRTRVCAGAAMQFDMLTVEAGGQKLSYSVLDLARFIETAAASVEEAALQGDGA